MHIRQLLRRKGGDVATVDATASVRTALALLAEHHVGALVGIVSIGDVVKARLDELEEERAQLVGYIQTS